MSILARLFGRVPEWASFFTAEDYRAFVSAVKADLETRGYPYSLQEGEGLLLVRLREEEPNQCGLLNVAQVCQQNAQADWPRILAEHFDRILTLHGQRESQLDSLEHDFEAARRLLKVRLYSEDVTEKIGRQGPVWKHVAGGLIAMLVYDFPDSVASVADSHVQAWDRPTDELYDIALRNVRAEGMLEGSEQEVEPAVPLTLLSSDSHFAASHALFLGEYLRPEPPHGALVAIPHRHALIYHPIRDAGVIKAINVLIPAAQGMHAEGPGSISPDLYWYRTGKLTQLPCRVSKNQIEFLPPPEFVEQVLTPVAGVGPE